jgi:hypothetical protein
MHQDRLRQKSVNRDPQSFVRQAVIAYDERIAFIESVCATLIESRFGPGRTSQLIVNLSDRPELEKAVFFDLSDNEKVPCYALSPLGRQGYQVVEAAYRRAKTMALAARRRSLGRIASCRHPRCIL